MSDKLEDYPCATTVSVKPPPNDELKLTTHWGCANLSFWFKIPGCIGCRSTGSGALAILCCCAETYATSCGLVENIDTCCFQHGVCFCISLSQCREKGCAESVWSKSSGKCLCCFLFQQSFDCTLQMPHSCLKCAVQECCFDCRCALPCDQDVPCGCSCCGKWFKEPDAMPTGWNE